MKTKKTILTVIVLLSCIIIWYFYTPFSEDNFYRAIPENTTLFCEMNDINSNYNSILESHPTRYFIDDEVKSTINSYQQNKKIKWITRKLLSKKSAFGYSQYTGQNGNECFFAIIQINSIQQVAKLILNSKAPKELTKTKLLNNQKIWSYQIDKKQKLNFSFSDGMLIATIEKDSSSIEQIIKKLSTKQSATQLVNQSIDDLKNINSDIKGFYIIPEPHSRITKALLFSAENFSREQTRIKIYPTDDILNLQTIPANDIQNMLETINYYPTCFLATTPKLITTIWDSYMKIPKNMESTISIIENNPTFIASASQKYSGKVLKLKTPSIMIGSKLQYKSEPILISAILKNLSTPKTQLYVSPAEKNKQNHSQYINIITTSEKNKYSQQPNSDKIAFATKNDITIFSSHYSVLNKILSKPQYNMYEKIAIPDNTLAFAIIDIPKTISLINDYIDIYTIYLIVSSDSNLSKKRSDIDNQIRPILNKIQIPGTITASITQSIKNPYTISIKIEHK